MPAGSISQISGKNQAAMSLQAAFCLHLSGDQQTTKQRLQAAPGGAAISGGTSRGRGCRNDAVGGVRLRLLVPIAALASHRTVIAQPASCTLAQPVDTPATRFAP